MIVVLTGVTGVGKTTVGRRLAGELGARFVDADDLHSTAAVERMRAGHGLDDADREPWLRALERLIDEALLEGHPLVIACSALKEAYRHRLERGPEVVMVQLTAAPDVLRARLRERSGHFADERLLPSQLADFEPAGSAAHVVDAGRGVEDVVAMIRQHLAHGTGSTPDGG